MSHGTGEAGTLGEHLARRDAASFVGRRRELGLLAQILERDSDARVAIVHGPGGIGKSALLRELERRARRSGYEPLWVEGRDLIPDPDALGDALRGIRDLRRPLVIVDSHERIAAIDPHLRAVIARAPADCRVVIASRLRPGEAWLSAGWERLVIELGLGPLDDGDGLALLASRRELEPARARELNAWARGSPLALTLASEVGWEASSAGEPPRPDDLLPTLVDRLAAAELDTAHAAPLGVAATARAVTVEMLEAVLPQRPAATDFEWLAGLSFSEPVGEGIALHDLVRRALYEQLRRRAPEHERRLRRAVADYLYERARRGDVLLSIDLAHLVASPAIRWGYSWELAGRLRVDDPRPGDAEDAARFCRDVLADDGMWLGTAPYFEHVPEHVTVARDPENRLCGYTVALTPESAPRLSADDPVLGPWLEHARRTIPGSSVVLWREVVDMTGDPGSGVISVLGMAGVLRAARGNPRFAYLPIDPAVAGTLEFSAALAAEHIAELDAQVGPREIQCHRVDYGPGGLLAAQRALVYRELGLAAPDRSADFEAADMVRDALRDLHSPHELAKSRLASGETPEERAAHARSLLVDAAEHAFGDAPGEQLTRRVLARAYVDPASGHEQAAQELSLSRSAYFRRLKLATERVTDYLAEHGSL